MMSGNRIGLLLVLHTSERCVPGARRCKQKRHVAAEDDRRLGKQVASAGARQHRGAQVNSPLARRATYSRLELFQYTACRSLALDRCKFVSASVRRLRENRARAIILLPVLVRPWVSPLSLPPCASPLRLSRAGDASFTTSRRSQRERKKKKRKRRKKKNAFSSFQLP